MNHSGKSTRADYHHQDTITISKSHSILMNFIDFIKTGLPVKLPNMTVLSVISSATILTNIFAKQSPFCSYTLLILKRTKIKKQKNKKQKKQTKKHTTTSEWYYREGENLQGPKTIDS